MLTAAQKPSDDPRALLLIHGAVGVVDELGELLDTPELSQEELGDVWWYLAIAVSALEAPITFDGASSWADQSSAIRREIVAKCFQRSVLLLGYAKKVYFGGHDLDAETKVAGHTHRSIIYSHLRYIAQKLALIDPDPVDTWEKNIAKLRQRYRGGGFDSELSQNRD